MINKEELVKSYKDKGYTTTQVALILGISRRSLYNLLDNKMPYEKRNNYIKLIIRLKPLYNANFINQPITLDKDIEEAFDRLFNDNLYEDIKEQIGDSPSTILTFTVEEQKEADLDTIKSHILAQASEIKEYEEMFNTLEPTNPTYEVLSKRCARVESKLTAIEEVVKATVYKSDRQVNEFFVDEAFNKIKQIIGGNNEK